jgi:hypothetical protein
MKTVRAYENPDNTATYYIDIYGDIFDTQEDAEVFGVAGKVIVDGFFVGTIEEMRLAALDAYQAATA